MKFIFLSILGWGCYFLYLILLLNDELLINNASVNRIDRVSAILIQLQSKKIVTAAEIANRFEISIRTVYRDIRALEEAGVPLGAEPGKGYSLVDGYRLPPVMFTPEEASSLLTAEKIVEKMADLSVERHYKSAMYKIKAVLPEREKQFLDRLNSNIEIFHSPPAHAAEAPNNCMLPIQKALADQKVLVISYRAAYNNQLVTGRMVEPVGLVFYSMAWHLIGYCRFRKDYRDFRLDRITCIDITNENFQTRGVKSVHDFFRRNLSEFQLEQVTLRFPKKEAGLMQSTRYYYGYIGEEMAEDHVNMNFIVYDAGYFCRWLLMYADVVEILHNEKLRHQFMELVIKIKNRFS
ncbi:MAG: YafY family transcriptional regulator [Bacteroidales bacterium]|nr:YafY family transcriptional regulator [Bacteroidales bacterium]